MKINSPCCKKLYIGWWNLPVIWSHTHISTFSDNWRQRWKGEGCVWSSCNEKLISFFFNLIRHLLSKQFQPLQEKVTLMHYSEVLSLLVVFLLQESSYSYLLPFSISVLITELWETSPPVLLPSSLIVEFSPDNALFPISVQSKFPLYSLGILDLLKTVWITR